MNTKFGMFSFLTTRLKSIINHSFESGNKAHKKTNKNIKNTHEKQTDRDRLTKTM